MNKIKLSFCIPTYNNEKSVIRLVSSILECDNLNIEVVVLDNGSTDGTLDLLETINDERLNVYSNGINKGALFNMMNVLDKGKGQYLVYCTDHDYVDKKGINRFSNFLGSNTEIAFGYCLYNSNTKDHIEIYNSGFEALNKLGYSTRHPTGYFFKREYWKLIDSVNRFSDYEFVDLFPLEFVFAELSLLGKGVVYHDSLFTPETGERVVNHKSATTKGNSKTSFFAPECRLKLAINFHKHIHTLAILPKEKQSLILKSFFRELNAATFGYMEIMNNEKLCIHYHMDKRLIGFKELTQISLMFFDAYLNNLYTKNGFYNKSVFLVKLLLKPKKVFTFLYLLFRVYMK